MKPAPTSVRTLRVPTPSRDRSACVYPPYILVPSPIATSSRVRLPPSPSSFIPPRPTYNQRSISTSAPLHSPPPATFPTSEGGLLKPWKPTIPRSCVTDIVKRILHSSAQADAQALEREQETYADPDRNWRDFPTFTAEEIAGFDPKYSSRNVYPSKVGVAQDMREAPVYEPTEADFGFSDPGSNLGEDVSWSDGYGADLEDVRQGMDVWEEPMLKKPKKRTKKLRLQIPDLPPLQPGETLAVEEERYNWQKTSLSQTKRASGSRWFPEQRNIVRSRAKVNELEEGDKFFKPVSEYDKHFRPLIMAEHAEEQRAHAERQLLWSPEKLKAEGYMVEDVGASIYPYHRKPNAYIYTFAKTGKAASGKEGDLKFHIFKSGTVTELCRTHPHYDYVKTDGKTRDGSTRVASGDQYAGGDPSETPLLAQPIEKLLGSVYSVGRKFIRVSFPTPIEGIESGHWRLDEGCNDIAVQRQLEAIRLLNADPTKTERSDYAAAIRQAEYPPPSYVSPRHSDEDEAFNEPTRTTIHQTVFQGTNLRDKLLWAFQEDFVPQDTSVSLHIGDKLSKSTPVVEVPALAETHPGDIDATPIPPPHPAYEAPSILSKNELIASWTTRYRAEDGRPPVRVEGDPDVPLNPSQMRAIAMMLSERLSLVQGPPGTGKTRVIIETIKLLKQHWKIPHPILVTAHTNAAVDNLLSGLRDHGLKAVRLGNDQAVRADLRQWTVERLQEEHPLFAKWEESGREMQAMDTTLLGAKKGSSGNEKSVDDTENRYYDMSRNQVIVEKTKAQGRRRGLRQAIVRDIVLDADVICTTCLSAASWTLDAIDFPIVFLDEASMATEPLSLIPLMKGSSHVAIIGDHKQLPPVIVSEVGQLGGLATSMFERLIHEHNIPSIMLDTQYRMHPQIAHFPNRAFYASALANGTAEIDGSVRPGFEPPITDFLVEDDDGKRQNVTFVHHNSPEDPSSKSIRNAGEAARVCDVVTDLLLKNPTLKGSDIGVITPYRAQIRQLTEYLRTDSERTAIVVDLLGHERAQELENIEIKTVDGFEGREKAVIIFSTVRNNPGGYIGFMADWRRLNVGLTRAKRALIILGSADHLARSKVGAKAADLLPAGGAQVWRELMAWLNKEGLILREED